LPLGEIFYFSGRFCTSGRESQLAFEDSNESPSRVSTAKQPISVNDSSSTIGLKYKLNTLTLIHLEDLRLIIERIVKGTIDLNDRMRNIYQINYQRIH
jgi:hypothetical protein